MRNCKAWYLSAGICFASWIAAGNVFDDVVGLRGDEHTVCDIILT
mgnify:CR=1 FL=1